MNRRTELLLLMALAVWIASLARAQAPDAAQGEGSLDWYYRRATEAIEKENYENAIRIIEEGKKLYPAGARLNVLLGDLYYDQELYGLALEEYLAADSKEAGEHSTLTQIARCYGKLNREADSIRTLKRVLELYPESIESIDDLAWMYFKTYQLDKAEKLLREALERFGPDKGLFMTLGTVCSGLYDYAGAKHYYEKAIAEAKTSDDDYFASVAYYNLSLLEHNFYHFNSALRATEESIRSADRAPGHLARGELFQSRMDFRLAHSEFQQALVLDKTPLSKVNLARLYQKFGRLELARRYAEEVLAAKDLSWIYYYGTDLERHYKDVHELAADVYLGLARALRPRTGPLETLASLAGSLLHRLRSYYHRQKFRLYSLKVGAAHLGEGNRLDAYWEFYRGNQAYRRVAMKYLHLAREIETRVAPHAQAYYLYEEGKLRRDPLLLKGSLTELDPFWEKEGIADTLRALIPLLKKGTTEQREALNRLYEINPGAFLQYGFGLPLAVELQPAGAEGSAAGARSDLQADRDSAASSGDRLLRRLVRLLRRSGSQVLESGLPAGSLEHGFRYLLWLGRPAPDRLAFQLTDRRTGRVLFRDSVYLEMGSVRRRALRCLEAILDKLYSDGLELSLITSSR